MTTRIPLGDLERAARDLSGYRARLGVASRSGFRYGYFNLLRDTIRRFHDTREDEVQARVYLEDRLTRFKDASKKAETALRFGWYVEEHRRMRRVTVETMGRVAVRLPPWAPADLVCSGEITRIDIIPNGGLAGWLFRNDDVRGWHQELRMPLIQDTLAHEMGLGVEEITVGVYGFQQQVVDQRTYSVGEVQAAYSRLDDLLGQLGF